MKNTLRVKKINEFIDSLNEREQDYLRRQINKKCLDRDIDKLDFTIVINGKKSRVIA